MRQRAISKYRPGLERFEVKCLLNASPLTASHLALGTADRASFLQSSVIPSPLAPRLVVSRITNPTPTNAQLNPPFPQVLVQADLPRPGAVYNVLSVSMRNSTSLTFDASSGFTVGVTGGNRAYPILTGTDQWTPGQVRVFYILTKKYYPPNPVTSAGFVFNLGGSKGVAIPGPSGIFLRVRYNPATFEGVLDWIVAHGPGSKGHLRGLPDTAIWEFTRAKAPKR